jgi:citrate synthase
MSYSKGLEGVVATETKISFIDGEKGVLEFIGIPIGELASNSSFEESVFFLWNGRLPKKAELADFESAIRARYDMPAYISQLVMSMPKDAQPMHVLRTAVSAMGLIDPKPNATDLPSVRDKALTLLAVTPTILGAFHRYRKGLPIIAPDKTLPIAANVLYMISGTKPTPTMAKALDVCLVLHTDHGLNNSTFSANTGFHTLLLLLLLLVHLLLLVLLLFLLLLLSEE